MEQRVDLGPCRAIRHDRDSNRFVILLPGRFYPTRAPALWFAREAAMAIGWSALEVRGEPGEQDDELGWERRCANAAIEAAAGAGANQIVVIGKSLASLLAGEIADRDLPAVWLTPLLTEPSAIEGLARTRRPVLLAGGEADPTWRLDAVPADRPIEVLDLHGVDHSVQVPGDVIASLSALGRLTEGIIRFLERVGAAE
jgi:hypothetical protein